MDCPMRRKGQIRTDTLVKLLPLDMPEGERHAEYRRQLAIGDRFRKIKGVPRSRSQDIIEQLLDDLEVYAKPLGLIKETKNAVD